MMPRSYALSGVKFSNLRVASAATVLPSTLTGLRVPPSVIFGVIYNYFRITQLPCPCSHLHLSNVSMRTGQRTLWICVICGVKFRNIKERSAVNVLMCTEWILSSYNFVISGRNWSNFNHHQSLQQQQPVRADLLTVFMRITPPAQHLCVNCGVRSRVTKMPPALSVQICT